MTEPRRNVARSGNKRQLSVVQAKKVVLEHIEAGLGVRAAMEKVGRAEETYRDWRKHDETFRDEVDRIREIARAARARGSDGAVVPDFPEFCEQYLFQALPLHHQRIWDVISGDEPREMHPSLRYQTGRSNRVCINMPPYHAKFLKLATELPTPSGWTTMGEVQVGDYVLGRDGKPTRVTHKSEVFTDRRTFRLTWANGATLIAGDEHQWYVRGRSNRREGVRTTLELFEKFTEGADRRPIWSTPIAAPLQLPGADLPIDPYVLGAWLGDGTSAGNGMTSSPEDQPFMRAQFEAAGYKTRALSDPRGLSWSVLGVPFRAAGVLNNKHVPAAYLRASHEQRLALLQGLMDTDGTCSKAGQASFSTMREHLADQVHELCRTLGIKARIYKSAAMLNGIDHGVVYNVSFWPHADMPVFRLPRKIERQVAKGTRQGWEYITNIEEIAPEPAQCISVDNADRLYLAGEDFTVTHNSAVWSANYMTWLVCKDPNIRIAIVSQTQDLAKKLLYQVKMRLTSPKFSKMHAAFMPDGGWKGDSWTSTEIYLAGVTADQKDPTIQALGWGSQIYGSRRDVIIIDDLTDGKHFHDHQKHVDWIGSEADSRVDDDGTLIVLGTRWGQIDVYSELRDQRDWDDAPLWTYFAQPAVLDRPGPDPNTWKILWPEQTNPDGTRGGWTGLGLARKKAVVSEARWQMTYQQQDAPSDVTFPVGAVRAAIDGRRAAAPMDGLWVVGGCDPAAAGYTAMIVMGVDRKTGQRFVLDGHNEHNCAPEKLKGKLKEFTERYKIREWVIEKNGFQGFLTRDEELRQFMFRNGCILRDHWTDGKKWDEDLGVLALAPLFLSCADYDPKADKWTPRPVDQRLITLPNPKFSTFVDDLIAQLCTWAPETAKKGQLTDMVMALWFANIGCQRVLDQARSVPTHIKNPYLNRADMAKRQVLNLTQLFDEQRQQQLEPTYPMGA